MENIFKLVMIYQGPLKSTAVSTLHSKNTVGGTSTTLPGPPV